MSRLTETVSRTEGSSESGVIRRAWTEPSLRGGNLKPCGPGEHAGVCALRGKRGGIVTYYVTMAGGPPSHRTAGDGHGEFGPRLWINPGDAVARNGFGGRNRPPARGRSAEGNCLGRRPVDGRFSEGRQPVVFQRIAPSSKTTFPPTIVVFTRPVSFLPCHGELRLFDWPFVAS